MTDIEPQLDRLLLIVAGAHLRAELNDRAAAHMLRDIIAANPDTRTARLQVAVCTDVWYLNNDDLRARPTISVGSPDVNALTAFLVDRLPAALTIDDVLTIQMDLEFIDPVAACWGMTHADTRQAAETFAARYLHPFLERVIRSLADA